jgi:hypothetical protein
MKMCSESKVTAPRIPDLCSKWRLLFSFTSRVIDLAIHWIGKWVNLAVLDAMAKGNKLLLPPAGNSTLVVQPVAHPADHFTVYIAPNPVIVTMIYVK